MPLYEYRCLDCDHKFEELIGKSVPEKSVICPQCGSEKCERLFSTFAAAVGGKAPSACDYGGGCGGGFT